MIVPRPARRRPSPALIVAVLALAVAAGGTAWATIPDGGGTIQGCYDPSGAKAPYPLSVVDKTTDCHAPAVLLPFAQTGPAGPTGATGATGSPGTPGVPGDSGPAGTAGAGGYVYTGGFNADAGSAPRTLSDTRPTSIVHLSLPAGSYSVVAEASVGLKRGSFAQVACWLSNDQTTARAGRDAHYFPLGTYSATSPGLPTEGRVDLHAAFTAPAAVQVILSCGIDEPRPGVLVNQAIGSVIATSETQVTTEASTPVLSSTAPPASVLGHLHVPPVLHRPATKTHR